MSIPGKGSTLGSRILFSMQRMGLDQPTFAKSIGTRQPVVSRWLPPKNVIPEGRFLLRMPDVLRVNGHWLLTGEGSIERDDHSGNGDGEMSTAIALVRAAVLAALDRLGKPSETVSRAIWFGIAASAGDSLGLM